MGNSQTDNKLRRQIELMAGDIGFDLVSWCGPVLPKIEAQRLNDWIAKGYHGEMHYLANNPHRRCDLRAIDRRCRSALVLGLEYGRGVGLRDMDTKNDKGWVSFYAWGRDYHLVVDDMAGQLAKRIGNLFEGDRLLRRYVDTGPPMEKAFAVEAGLGWLGKNCCLIHPRKGSYLFLAMILTTLPAPQKRPARVRDFCGSCRRCLDICPTDAFPRPYELDGSRCISYLTIELKGQIPVFFRDKLAGHIFGCDLCQMVCPWNQRFAGISPHFPSNERDWGNVDLHAWSTLEPEQFALKLRGSPLKRAKRRGILRNIIIAMAATKSRRFRPDLERLQNDPEPLVASHARWALQKIRQKDGHG